MTKRTPLSLDGLLRLLWGAWLGLLTLFFFSLALVIALLMPVASYRHAAARLCARLIFRCAGIPVIVHGNNNLGKIDNFILVANHASYLDGILLTGFIDRDFGFVAKHELKNSLPIRLFLKRIGSEFVKRGDRRQSAAVNRKITSRAGSGGSLAYFPEGTFREAPGLLPFRAGAFVAAVRAGVPVVPVAISGTRTILPAHHWLPTRYPVTVSIFAPIHPQTRNRDAIRSLQDAARQQILEGCGEPDAVSAGSRQTRSP